MELPKEFTKAPVQLLILFATLGLFLLTNALWSDTELGFVPVLVGVLIVLEMGVFIGLEVKTGAKKHGWKHEIVDTIIALFVAVAIWLGLSFVLSTSSPISAVVSCSMLPELQRGDFILVQGADVNAYEIIMSKEELESLTEPATIYYDGKNITINGSISPYCNLYPVSDMCDAFFKSPEKIVEQKGAFIYRYEMCSMEHQSRGTIMLPCLKSVTFRGDEYLTNFSNDVIVYGPPPTDLYYYLQGDVVHRVMFKINSEGETYYITRGDNNPVLDIQSYYYGADLANHPVPDKFSRGKVIARVPFLGYFKLFIHGYFEEYEQCRTQLQFTHAS